MRREPNFFLKQLKEQATFFILDELEKEHFGSAYAKKSSYQRGRRNANYYQAARDYIRGKDLFEIARDQDVGVEALRNGLRLLLVRIDTFKKLQRIKDDPMA